MKNIFALIMLMFSSTLYSSAQSNKEKQVEPDKSITVEEVNSKSGVSNPTINGKPYSQYKAEQDALKQKQQAAKQIAQQNKGISVSANDKPSTVATSAQKAKEPTQEQTLTRTAPQSHKIVDAGQNTAGTIEAVKPATINKEGRTAPVEATKTTVANNQKIVTTPVENKPVDLEAAGVKTSTESAKTQTIPVKNDKQ